MKKEEKDQFARDGLIAFAEAMARLNNVDIPNKLKIALSKLKNGTYTIDEFQKKVGKLAVEERNYLGGS
jgi:hypothetical protein